MLFKFYIAQRSLNIEQPEKSQFSLPASICKLLNIVKILYIKHNTTGAKVSTLTDDTDEMFITRPAEMFT